MLRTLLTATLSLLLFGMQLGAQLHALEHDRERLARPHGAALLAPAVDNLCAICASFAAGADASSASNQVLAALRPATTRVAAASAAPAGSAPAYYQSRAPPVLL